MAQPEASDPAAVPAGSGVVAEIADVGTAASHAAAAAVEGEVGIVELAVGSPAGGAVPKSCRAATWGRPDHFLYFVPACSAFLLL